MESSTKVGRKGEKTLNKWATDVDCSINKAIEDDNGWDFLLEFPPDLTPDGKLQSLDKVDSPLKCWVQVKSTNKQKRRVSVTLKNWLKLVNTPYPAFFLIYEFDNKTKCQRAFLCHVGENEIARVYKKLRKLGSQNRDKLHKKKMQLKYDKANLLPTLDGLGLRNAIFQYVKNTDDYISWKQTFRKNVGYDKNREEVKLSILSSDEKREPIEDLVDLTLGLIPRIHITQAEFKKDIRFGIASPEDTELIKDDGYLEIVEHKPVGKGIINFYLDDFSMEASLEADLYIPTVFSFRLDDKFWKIRLSTQIIDVVLSETFSEIKLHLMRYEEIDSIVELCFLAQWIQLCTQAIANKRKVNFKVWIKDEIYGHGDLPNISHFSPDLVEQSRLIIRLWHIAKAFDIERIAKINIKQIIRQEGAILSIYDVLYEKETRYRLITFGDDYSRGEECMAPILVKLSFEEHLILCVLVVSGLLEPDEDNKNEIISCWKVMPKSVFAGRKKMFLKSQSNDSLKLLQKQLLEATIEEYRESKTLIFTEDVKAILQIS